MTSLKMLPGGLVLSMLARSILPSVRALAPSLHLMAFCYKSDIGRLIQIAARHVMLTRRQLCNAHTNSPTQASCRSGRYGITRQQSASFRHPAIGKALWVPHLLYRKVFE